MKKIFLSILILMVTVATLFACDNTNNKPYFGTYANADGTDNIVIDANDFKWGQKSYTYSCVDNKITVNGNFAGGKTYVDFNIFENNQILSAGILVNFSAGTASTRNGSMNVNFVDYSGNLSPISAVSLRNDNTFIRIYYNEQTLSNRGTYTLKNGLLIFTGVYTISNKPYNEHWYIAENFDIHWQPYVKDINLFMPTQANPSNTYNLTYIAETGGTIAGSTNQTIESGRNGTSVTAVANSGYKFTQWSDGLTTATRQDSNVIENKTVTAQFSIIEGPQPITYNLTYIPETGGTITGSTNQTIESGRNGTSVTAVANSGYEFTQWSDGLTTATRQDSNVIENKTVTAQFQKTSDNTTEFAGGSGTINTPYKISTKEHLENIEKFSHANFVLINDIVLPIVKVGQSNFSPLCSDEVPFTGKLNGGNYEISNLSIFEEGFFVGLFACIGTEGKIENLKIINAIIAAPNYCGILAGLSQGEIINVSVSGNLSYKAINSYRSSFGGLVGRAEKTLTNCNSNTNIVLAEVQGSATIGGLAGDSVAITNCYSTGNIITNNNNNNSSSSGGLVGKANGELSNCYATGNVSVSGGYGSIIGGLVGRVNQEISNCYATGNISVSETGGNEIGGLAGYTPAISNCYATGNVSGGSNNRIGGLVGYASTISNCYSTGNVNSSGGGDNIGGLVGYISGASTNSHWLFYEERGAINAIGLSDSLGIPSNFGCTKYTKIGYMYNLAESLNAGQEEIAWKNVPNHLPKLIWQN